MGSLKDLGCAPQSTSAKFPCPHCKYPISSKNKLELHLRTCTPTASFNQTGNGALAGAKLLCPACGAPFATKNSLTFHLNRAHAKEESSDNKKTSKRLSCPSCDECFFHGKALNTHAKYYCRNLPNPEVKAKRPHLQGTNNPNYSKSSQDSEIVIVLTESLAPKPNSDCPTRASDPPTAKTEPVSVKKEPEFILPD